MLVLGGEEVDAEWLLLDVMELEMDAEEAELTEFLACCCCADRCGCCWVALL